MTRAFGAFTSLLYILQYLTDILLISKTLADDI